MNPPILINGARARTPGDESLPTLSHGNHPASLCNPLSTQRLIRDCCWTQNGYLAENRRMAAGFAAGVTEALVVVTPFEVVKIRLQQQKGLTKELLKYKVCSIVLHLLRSRFGLGSERDHRSSRVRAKSRSPCCRCRLYILWQILMTFASIDTVKLG